MSADAGNRPRSGLALLRKPEGITSFQALAPVKRALASSRVGHAGTLDRFARGLLVILAGSYSRLADYVQAGQKLYRGLISFGSETDTLDPEGEVVARADPPSREALEAALPAFRGPIQQVPPAYSAVHVGGKRAYELALRGEAPALKARTIEVYSLELLEYEGGKALVELRCSSGTYVRSLARDLALACGSRAHLGALERLSIGPFRVEEAVSPADFSPDRDLRPFAPEDAASLGLAPLRLGEAADVARFYNGGRLPSAAFEAIPAGAAAAGLASEAAVFDPDGLFLGVIGPSSEGPRYKFVMPAPERAAIGGP